MVMRSRRVVVVVKKKKKGVQGWGDSMDKEMRMHLEKEGNAISLGSLDHRTGLD